MIEQDRVLCSELSNYFHGGNRRGMTARKTNDVLHTDHNHLGFGISSFLNLNYFRRP